MELPKPVPTAKRMCLKLLEIEFMTVLSVDILRIAQMVLIRGLDNVVLVDDEEWKLPGIAVLSGAFCLDKWLSRNAQERS